MSDTRFTPGPWQVRERDERTVDFRRSIRDASGNVVSPRNPHDAALIAAAPDLYDALTECVAQIEYLHGKFQETGTGVTSIARANAALRKARGET